MLNLKAAKNLNAVSNIITNISRKIAREKKTFILLCASQLFFFSYWDIRVLNGWGLIIKITCAVAGNGLCYISHLQTVCSSHAFNHRQNYKLPRNRMLQYKMLRHQRLMDFR